MSPHKDLWMESIHGSLCHVTQPPSSSWMRLLCGSSEPTYLRKDVPAQKLAHWLTLLLTVYKRFVLAFVTWTWNKLTEPPPDFHTWILQSFSCVADWNTSPHSFVVRRGKASTLIMTQNSKIVCFLYSGQQHSMGFRSLSTSSSLEEPA